MTKTHLAGDCGGASEPGTIVVPPPYSAVVSSGCCGVRSLCSVAVSVSGSAATAAGEGTSQR